MKETTKIARKEIKHLIETVGISNIYNYHLNEIKERTGVSCIDLQNAMSYYKYRKSGKTYA